MNPLTPYLIWIKIAGAAVAAAAIAFGAWYVTSDHYELKIADMKIIQQKDIIIAQGRAADQQEAADKITHDIDVAAAEARQKIVYRTQTLIQKVPEYVTPETDARFPLPCGFIRLHDAAARGVDAASISLPAGKSDRDECGVATSTASSIIVGNYGLALGWKNDLINWQLWYDQQKTKWDAYRASVKKEN